MSRALFFVAFIFSLWPSGLLPFFYFFLSFFVADCPFCCGRAMFRRLMTFSVLSLSVFFFSYNFCFAFMLHHTFSIFIFFCLSVDFFSFKFNSMFYSLNFIHKTWKCASFLIWRRKRLKHGKTAQYFMFQASFDAQWSSVSKKNDSNLILRWFLCVCFFVVVYFRFFFEFSSNHSQRFNHWFASSLFIRCTFTQHHPSFTLRNMQFTHKHSHHSHSIYRSFIWIIM